MVLPPTLLKSVRIGEKADFPHAVHTVLLLRNPPEAIAIAVALVLVACPNLDRSHAIIPTLHHSSITLAALFSSSPPFPHHQYSLSLPISLQYTLYSKNLQ